jgi:hypothetical protein
MFAISLDLERAFVVDSPLYRTSVPRRSDHMVAVAQASPAPPRRLVVVQTTPVVRHAPVSTVAARTYRRRRLAAVSLLAAMLMMAFLAAHALLAPAGAAGSRAPEAPEVVGAVHVVQPGDTFWDIARSLRPDEDPRPLVARLVAAHGSPSLMVGERIRLPG